MIKITKIQGGYYCEGLNFNLLAFNLIDLFKQLLSIYGIKTPQLFTFDNLN